MKLPKNLLDFRELVFKLIIVAQKTLEVSLYLFSLTKGTIMQKAYMFFLMIGLAFSCDKEKESDKNKDKNNIEDKESVTRLYNLMETYWSETKSIDPYGFKIDDLTIKEKYNLVQSTIGQMNHLERKKLGTKTQYYFDLFLFDLKTKKKGCELGGIENNILAQIPITHMRNYVEAYLEHVFEHHNTVITRLLSSNSQPTRQIKIPNRIYDYFNNFTNQEKIKDLDHLTINSTKKLFKDSQYFRLSNSFSAIDFYYQKKDFNENFLDYIKEVKKQFEKGASYNNTLPKVLIDKIISQFEHHLTEDKIKIKYNSETKEVLDNLSFVKEENKLLIDQYRSNLDSIEKNLLDLLNYLENEYPARVFTDPIDGTIDTNKIPHGWSGMEDGSKWYEWLVNKETSKDQSVQEIHEIGLIEVKRILGEMIKICYRIGKCTTQDMEQAKNSNEIYNFFNYLKQQKFYSLNPHPSGQNIITNDQHDSPWWNTWSNDLTAKTIDKKYYPDYSSYPSDNFLSLESKLSTNQLTAYKEHRQHLKDYYLFKQKIEKNNVLDEVFSNKTITNLDYQIVPMSFIESSTKGIALYQSFDTGSEGVGGQFILNTYYPFNLPQWSTSSLLLHEAVPGHHFQIMIAQKVHEADSQLPDYIKQSSHNAYVEGWALYVEDLGLTHLNIYNGKGLYNPLLGEKTDEGVDSQDNIPSESFLNELQKFGKYNEEMLRAMRLVVDTGLHSLGWTYNKAFSYMKENSSLEEGDISTEIYRYMAYPGQALSYKAGCMTILKLRQELARKLGQTEEHIPSEILKEFHHQILELGSLPLEVLENKIQNWIQSL